MQKGLFFQIVLSDFIILLPQPLEQTIPPFRLKYFPRPVRSLQHKYAPNKNKQPMFTIQYKT